jgi:hypothetical protein
MRVIYRDWQQTTGECLDEGQSQSPLAITCGDIDLENAQLSAVHIISRKVHSHMLVQ